MLDDLILIALLLGAYLYWFNGQQVKEIALKAVRAHCLNLEVQMLDEYVALNSIRLKRIRQEKCACGGHFCLNFLQPEMSVITAFVLCWDGGSNPFRWSRTGLTVEWVNM